MERSEVEPGTVHVINAFGIMVCFSLVQTNENTTMAMTTTMIMYQIHGLF